MQTAKAVLLVRLRAAQQLGEDENLAAIDALRAAFPDDPGLHLATLDALITREQWDEAHAALSAINEAVGGDPYLHSVRGNLYVLEGKLEEAESMADLMLAQDPTWQDAYWLQVSVALAQHDHPRTARLLTKIRDELGAEILDLTQIAEYAEFVKSPEYAEWKNARPLPAGVLP
jgi:predicted Zn-dependent protease